MKSCIYLLPKNIGKCCTLSGSRIRWSLVKPGTVSDQAQMESQLNLSKSALLRIDQRKDEGALNPFLFSVSNSLFIQNVLYLQFCKESLCTQTCSL